MEGNKYFLWSTFLPGITLSALCALISYNSLNNHVVNIIIIAILQLGKLKEIK